MASPIKHTESTIVKRLKKITTDWWGPRCEDYADECACCQAWEQTDHLIRLVNDGAEEVSR